MTRRHVLAAGAALAVVATVVFYPGGTSHRRPPVTPTTAQSGHCRPGIVPDLTCTPGATNPQVTQATIRSTICVVGWTKTVRPPASVTARIKTERMAAYGVPQPPSLYELDHLISLELGGSPAAVANLWPEPYAGPEGARAKDRIENRLKREVCAGSISLATAQHAISTDWRTAP